MCYYISHGCDIMKIITINEEELRKKYKQLKVSRNCESTLYLVGNELYKILNLPYDILDSENRMYSRFLKDRENIVCRLMDINPSGSCNPKALLIDEKYFLGCVYPYLNGYDDLLSKHYPIEVRTKLCSKLNETFRRLWKQNFQYTDLSIYNVMTNGYDIKFVDMDSVSMNEFKTYEEEKRFLIFTCQQLSILSLSLLLDIDIDSLNLNNYDLLKKLSSVLGEKSLVDILAYSLEMKYTSEPYFVDKVLKEIDLKSLDKRIKKQFKGEAWKK